MDREDNLTRDLRFIGGLVARLEDQPPPDTLLAGVMAGIQPKKPSARRLAWRFLNRPQYIRFTPIRLIYAVFLLAVVLAGWSWIGPFRPTSPARGPSPFVNAGMENYRFTVNLPRASSVAVIGDFNDWNPKGYEMTWDESCRCYNLSLPLPRGRYQYAFLVDGRILADPRSVLTQEDGFGHRNSILIINHDRDRHYDEDRNKNI